MCGGGALPRGCVPATSMIMNTIMNIILNTITYTSNVVVYNI
jgi:hypothetical protein